MTSLGSMASTYRSRGSYEPVPAPTLTTDFAGPSASTIRIASRGSSRRNQSKPELARRTAAFLPRIRMLFQVDHAENGHRLIFQHVVDAVRKSAEQNAAHRLFYEGELLRVLANTVECDVQLRKQAKRELRTAGEVVRNRALDVRFGVRTELEIW